MCLVVEPSYLGLDPPVYHTNTTHRDTDSDNKDDNDGIDKLKSDSIDSEKTALVKTQEKQLENENKKEDKKKNISFFRALLIPGVIEYSFALAFGKLVAYTFLFWLPLYIQNTNIGGYSFNAMFSADLSVIFDVGGIAGVITGGVISDIIKSR